jgi:hypothetical protein
LEINKYDIQDKILLFFFFGFFFTVHCKIRDFLAKTFSHFINSAPLITCTTNLTEKLKGSCQKTLLKIHQMTAIKILTNTKHPTRQLYTSRIYDHYATKPMLIRAMEYLLRTIWNRYKKNLTHPKLHETTLERNG